MRPDTFLESLQIARPCDARWEDMVGDARVRHCGACRLNVYDLSMMTRHEATTLVQESEGRVCIRMLRRADGTVVTDDCVDRLTRARRSGVSTFAIALAFSGAMLASACGVGAGQADTPTTATNVHAQVTDEDEPELMMGDIGPETDVEPETDVAPETDVEPEMGDARPLMGAPMPLPDGP